MTRRKPAKSRRPAKASRRRPPKRRNERPSLRALARALGVSHTAVEKAVANGRLPRSVARTSSGLRVLDPELARQEWQANASKPTAIGDGPTNGDGASTLSLAQVLVARERAEGLRLANLQKTGRLIDRALEERRNFERARIVRDRMRAIPDRVSPQLAVETESSRIHEILAEEIDKALASLAELLDHDPPVDGASSDDEDRGDGA